VDFDRNIKVAARASRSHMRASQGREAGSATSNAAGSAASEPTPLLLNTSITRTMAANARVWRRYGE
jgi:hypothetical protein